MKPQKSNLQIDQKVKTTMDFLKNIHSDTIREALARTDQIYSILAQAPTMRNADLLGVGAQSAGTWTVLFYCDWETVADLKKDHRYRICNKGPDSIFIWVDGVKSEPPLSAGSCRDVEGKKIAIHLAIESSKIAGGSYENLD